MPLTRISLLLTVLVLLPPPSALSGATGEAGRVPPLPGPAIRVDFERPFIEEWLGAAAGPTGVALARAAQARWDTVAHPDSWAGAAALGPLYRGEPATEILAFHGAGALFLRIKNFRPPAFPDWEPTAETVEVLLREPIEKLGRFRLRERPENPLFTFALGPGGEIPARRDGEPVAGLPWERSLEVSEESWTALVMIPLASLGIGLPGKEMEINIVRRSPSFEPVSWGPDPSSPAHRRIFFGKDPVPGNIARSGRGISLELISGKARPQDRWVEGRLVLDWDVFRPGDEVEVSLLAPGTVEPLEAVSVFPGRLSGRLLVDARRLDLESGRVTARLIRQGAVLGTAEVVFRAAPLPAPYPEGFRVPLAVNAADGPAPPPAWPLTAGVPFPAGALWDAGGWVVEDGSGKTYPTQLEITGRWAFEGSVKWLRVDTVAPPDAELFLVRRPGTLSPAPENPVSVAEEDGRYLLGTAGMTWEISAAGSPVRAIRSGGRLLADASNTRGLYLVDQAGRQATASAEGARVTVEAAGPVSACVRIEGDYRTAEGEALARHITRVEMAAGQPFARVVHTLVMTRDTRETWFREVGWEFEVAPGAGPETIFGVSRDDPLSFHRVAGEGESWLIQESHFRFGAGENRFSLFSGAGTLAGEQMGDWVLLQGDSGGLLLSCRESARQHPKEFHSSGRVINLKLFSSRAGEELDFRTDTLVERWNLREWFLEHGISPWIQAGRGTHEERRDLVIEEVRKIPSNALGWAKTHEIMISPAVSRRPPAEAAALSFHHSRPVFTLPDPAWINRSRALGPLHPRDPERFPEAERLVEETLAFFASHVPRFGLWGFVDYNAGPTFNYPAGRRFPQPRRWNYTYTVRPDSWKVFARSGSREAHDFATGTCRAWGDNHFASWGGSGKVRGLYTTRSAPDEWTGSMALPFYWGHATQTHYDHMSDKSQFTLDYHLLGWRRAGDLVRDFAGGMLEAWTPGVKRAAWDVMPNFRLLMQCYEFTWDDRLRQLAENAFDYVEDPESAVGHHKDRAAYRSSTYKKGVHFRDVLAAREFFGHPRYRENMGLLGDFLWNRVSDADPVHYTSPTGLLGAYLYDETGSPDIPVRLLSAVRRASALPRGPGEAGVSMGAQDATFIFEGIPAALDVISRSDADRNPAAARLSVRDFGNPVSFFLFKEDPDTLHFSLGSPDPIHLAGGARLEMINPATMGPELMSARARSAGFSAWEVPRDVPAGVFRLDPATVGDHHVTAWGSRSVPGLVLHAPAWWVPMPVQDPPVKWFFGVPENGAGNPAVFFEGRARLFRPDGEPWLETGDTGEWVEIPPDRPGLWSFIPLEARLVRARDIPPFFSAGSADAWFDPGVSPEPMPEKPVEEMPPAGGFVSGPGGARGLYLPPGRSFTVPGGDDLGDGRGREFLPFHDGTVEFWMKPVDWGTFTMPGDPRAGRVMKHLARTGLWGLSYSTNRAPGAPAVQDQVLETWLGIENEERRWNLTHYRHYTIFEPGEWVHVAVTWGRLTRDWLGRPRTGMTLVTYLNGREGRAVRTNFPATIGYRPAAMPASLVMPDFGGVISQLRVSEGIRYSGDFEPPAVLRPDTMTRAYFSFDGTLEGVSGDGKIVEGRVSH